MTNFRLGEFHPFEGGGKKYLYLVPSGAVFELHALAADVISQLQESERSLEQLLASLQATGLSASDADELLRELYQAHVITSGDGRAPETIEEAPIAFPLSSLVLNITNQCNLSCKYCYEFGEDKLANSEGKAQYMPVETAQQAIDHLLANSEGRQRVHVTFFGGETLLNFRVMRSAIQYAVVKAREAGKSVDFSLTTNGTLLGAEVIEFLSAYRVGVTISLDGDREMNDQFRVFHDGRGSYDIIAPKVKELLARHKTRPIGARVTLTAQVSDVLKIYRHLTNDIGFREVGFAPVTTSPVRLYAIGGGGLDLMLAQFTRLANEYRECAVRGEHHGFSNVTDTLMEVHQGVSKAYPCGAGLGLMGVAPSGDIAPCHRFVDSDQHKLGHVSTGIDHAKQAAFLNKGHIGSKYECHTCFARPLCSGGCHHEAFVRYGDTGHANLHYCDWIRGWTDLCLGIYGDIASRNPEYLRHFEEERSVVQ
jgi:uncharacterized protein